MLDTKEHRLKCAIFQSGSYFEEGGVKIFGKLLFVCQVLNLRLVLIARGGRLDKKLLKSYPLCRTNNTANRKIQKRQIYNRTYICAIISVFVLYLALLGVHQIML